MSIGKTIDYYFAPQSPWTYLGHSRFAAIAAAAGATVRVRPIDLGSVFPVSGGLPLGKRAPSARPTGWSTSRAARATSACR